MNTRTMAAFSFCLVLLLTCGGAFCTTPWYGGYTYGYKDFNFSGTKQVLSPASVPGDIVIAWAATPEKWPNNIPAPAGWTEFQSSNSETQYFYHQVVSGDPSQYAFSLPQISSVFICRYTAGGLPVQIASRTGSLMQWRGTSVHTNLTRTIPSIYTTTAGAVVVSLVTSGSFADPVSQDTFTFGTPTGQTPEVYIATAYVISQRASHKVVFMLSDEGPASAGNIGSRDFLETLTSSLVTANRCSSFMIGLYAQGS